MTTEELRLPMHTNSSRLTPKQIRRRHKANMIAVAILLVFGAIYVVSNLVTSLPSADAGSSTAAPAAPAAPSYAIADSQYRSVAIGMRLGDVKGYLGNPEDAQQHSYGNGYGGTSSSTCVYYNDLNGNTGVYQFCFTNGTLTSKAKY